MIVKYKPVSYPSGDTWFTVRRAGDRNDQIQLQLANRGQPVRVNGVRDIIVPDSNHRAKPATKPKSGTEIFVRIIDGTYWWATRGAFERLK